MKRKFLIILCSVICVLCCVFGLSACTDKSDNNTNQDGTYTVQTAYTRAAGLGYSGSLEDFVILISGKDGQNGKDGKDGVGISTIFIDSGGDFSELYQGRIISESEVLNAYNVHAIRENYKVDHSIPSGCIVGLDAVYDEVGRFLRYIVKK